MLIGQLVDRGKGKKSSRKSNPIGISKTRSLGPMKKNVANVTKLNIIDTTTSRWKWRKEKDLKKAS